MVLTKPGLASGDCQAIGGQVLALDDCRQFSCGEFDVAIDEEQVPTESGSALTVHFTRPGNCGARGK